MKLLSLLKSLLPCTALLSLACSTMENSQEDPLYQKAITENTNTIGVSWLKERLGQTPKENIFVAPFPLVMGLSAMATGSEGKNRDQLWKFAAAPLYRMGKMHSQEDENVYLQQLGVRNRYLLHDIPGYSLSNSLTMDKNIRLYPEYRGRVEKNLAMQFLTNSPKIRKISSNAPVEGTLLVPYRVDSILNFNGKWATPFDPDLTENANFYPEGHSSSINIPFLKQPITTYKETDIYTLFWLDYAKSPVRFIAILPRKGYSVQQLIRHMGKNTLPEYLALTQSSPAGGSGGVQVKKDLFLPKFEYSNPEFSCKSFLKQQGVLDCFANRSDVFPRMMTPSPGIQEVYQENRLKIEEAGTSLHSRTTIISWETASPDEKNEIRASRPFLCFLVDTRTNMLLLATVINNPGRGY